VNASCEEHYAQSAAKIQEGLKEVEEEEEGLVLSCDDALLPPAISITADGGEVRGCYCIHMLISGSMVQVEKKWCDIYFIVEGGESAPFKPFSLKPYSLKHSQMHVYCSMEG
jgi:hypothetical protein